VGSSGTQFRNAEGAGCKHAQLAGPVHRDVWELTPATIDAEYSPGANEASFLAGVLQLFDPADEAYNHGNTGATIDHELSHAFRPTHACVYGDAAADLRSMRPARRRGGSWRLRS
jgi:predicted metalloendopeptidase